MADDDDDIGEALVRRNIISREQLKLAREVQVKTDKEIEAVILELGFAGQHEIAACRAAQPEAGKTGTDKWGIEMEPPPGDVETALQEIEQAALHAPEPERKPDESLLPEDWIEDEDDISCYEPIMEDLVVEYVCPACGEKTIYDSQWGFEADNVQVLRRRMNKLSNYPEVRLDESQFCRKCTPDVKELPLAQLVFTFDDGTSLSEPVLRKEKIDLLVEMISGKTPYASAGKPFRYYVDRWVALNRQKFV